MGAICRRILGTLPEWFGIPEAVEHYVVEAESSPCVVATRGADDVGLLVWRVHGEHAAEIVLIAVARGDRGRGVGRAMVSHLEASLVALGVEYLQVKTLSAAHPDPGYGETRAFYEACGFRVLEELPLLWGPDQPAVQLVKRVAGVR